MKIMGFMLAIEQKRKRIDDCAQWSAIDFSIQNHENVNLYDT